MAGPRTACVYLEAVACGCCLWEPMHLLCAQGATPIGRLALHRMSRHLNAFSRHLPGRTQASADNDAEANRHTMLRPRSWWEAKFAQYGADVNREMYWAMQDKSIRYDVHPSSLPRVPHKRSAGDGVDPFSPLVPPAPVSLAVSHHQVPGNVIGEVARPWPGHESPGRLEDIPQRR